MSAQEPKKPFAKKSLGQNFLVDKNAIHKIAAAIPTNTPLLLEIGPGRGALSTELFAKAQTFCLLEKDDLFAKNIGETLFVHGSRQHFVFHEDALEFDWEQLWQQSQSPIDTPLVVASNLPYNVATEILFRLLAMQERIPLMVLMFQKEVALRIAAACGKKEYGSISVLVQNLYEVRLQQILKPGAFRPSPKVDSAVLEFHRRAKPLVSFTTEADRLQFRALVRAAFAHRRKTLENSLRMDGTKLLPEGTPWGELLTSVGIDPKRRAETVSIQEFGALWKALHHQHN